MSPLVPQTFQVIEPAESGRQTGSVSKEVLGVLPVVAGAPEVSSREPSPAKTPAHVPSPRSTVSAPAGAYTTSQDYGRTNSGNGGCKFCAKRACVLC